MAELSCYNQTIVDDQSGRLDIVLVIPFLVAWLWTNIFTSLIWDFSYGGEKEHTYTWSPYFCKIIGETFFCIGCISILYIAKYYVHVASYYPSFYPSFYFGLSRMSKEPSTLLLLVYVLKHNQTVTSGLLTLSQPLQGHHCPNTYGTVPRFCGNCRGNVNQ